LRKLGRAVGHDRRGAGAADWWGPGVSGGVREKVRESRAVH
jgi:hypothetical protein